MLTPDAVAGLSRAEVFDALLRLMPRRVSKLIGYIGDDASERYFCDAHGPDALGWLQGWQRAAGTDRHRSFTVEHEGPPMPVVVALTQTATVHVGQTHVLRGAGSWVGQAEVPREAVARALLKAKLAEAQEPASC